MDGAEGGEDEDGVAAPAGATHPRRDPSVLVVVTLVVAGLAATWSLWHLGRFIYAEWRPDLVGQTVTGDSSHPAPQALWIGGTTTAVVLAATWTLVLAARHRPASRRVAVNLLAGILLLAGLRIAATTTSRRCALVTYNNWYVCAQGWEVPLTDAVSFVVPAAVVLALTSGQVLHRRRPSPGGLR